MSVIGGKFDNLDYSRFPQDRDYLKRVNILVAHFICLAFLEFENKAENRANQKWLGSVHGRRDFDHFGKQYSEKLAEIYENRLEEATEPVEDKPEYWFNEIEAVLL